MIKLSLVLKQFEVQGKKRDAYILTPNKEWDNLTKPSSIMILRSSPDEASVYDLITAGLCELSEKYNILFVFPNPSECDNDIAFLEALNREISCGIIDGKWSVMNDVHYVIGLGSGVDLALEFTSIHPETTAAVALIRGTTLPEANSTGSTAMPAILFNCADTIVSYYKNINKSDLKTSLGALGTMYTNVLNPYHKVINITDGNINKLTESMMREIWFDLFYTVRRINTCEKGNISERICFENCHFEKHLDDRFLGDNDGLAHTWLEHVPQCVLDNPSNPVPLVIFSHGAFDNPMKAADMSKWHEIGEKEGFITVYPLASNGINFNLNLDESAPSDVEFYLALIKYIKGKYPIDSSRVYLSGFSNGAGMSQVMAMLHPELIAAIAPIDSMWPYTIPGPFDQENFSLEKNLRPISIGLELQKKHNYRMPVWYVYGTREMEYPIYKGLGQQYQYDAWKQYNNIPVLETPEKPLDTECSIGVESQTVEVLYPCKQYPDYKYSIHKFYSSDTNENYYNFVLAHGKAHDVHIIDAELAWKFIAGFSRNPDGSLKQRSQ